MLVWQALRLYPTNSLFQFLHDPSSIVRTIAARELQTRAEIDVVFDYTASMVGSSKRRDREIAAFLLGQIGTPNRPLKAKSLPLLETLCRDSDAEIRATALSSLGRLDAKEALQIVRNALNDTVPMVVEAASEVLEWLE